MVGIGPGSQEDRTYRAVHAIQNCDVVVGYHPYVKRIEDLLVQQQCISTGMTHEIERVRQALHFVQQGKCVCLISSGDAGVYGMAGLALEMMEEQNIQVEVQMIPGISAANSAAACLGAPLMLDYCCISLSDLMIDWSQIERRLRAAASGDFVVALYNPRSVKRRHHLEDAVQILLEHRPDTTPVGIVHSIGLQEENRVFTTLGQVLQCKIDMRSTVIIGNTSTRLFKNWMLTPRGYDNKKSVDA